MLDFLQLLEYALAFEVKGVTSFCDVDAPSSAHQYLYSKMSLELSNLLAQQ